MVHRELLVVGMLVAVLCVAHCLSLGLRDQVSTGEQLAGQTVKRGRRITRDRYRMGYMFGKRSGQQGQVDSILVQDLTSKAMSVEDLGTALQKHRALAMHVAGLLDTNGDGYVSVSEML